MLVAVAANIGVAAFVIGAVSGVTAGDMRIPAVDIDDMAAMMGGLVDNGTKEESACSGKNANLCVGEAACARLAGGTKSPRKNAGGDKGGCQWLQYVHFILL